MTPTTHTHTIELTDEGEARVRATVARAGLSVGDWLQKLANKEAGEPDLLAQEIRWLTSRTPEQIAADREEVLKSSRPPRPLPPGKTFLEAVGGWPGDETDEEVLAALERLS